MSIATTHRPARIRAPRATNPAVVEASLASACALALSMLTYLPHVFDGGWVADDWNWVAHLHFGARDGIFGLVDAAVDYAPSRPLFGVCMSLLYLIGGTGQAPYLLVATFLVAVEGGLMYWVLRLARLSRSVAGAASALLVLLPTVDASRIWLAALPATIAVCLLLGGLGLALVAFRANWPRRAIALHAASLACFAASILTYELTTPIVALAVLLYLPVAGRRMAVRRWLADLALVAVYMLAASSLALSWRPANTSIGGVLDRVPGTVAGAWRAFESNIPGVIVGWPGAILVAAAIVGLVQAARRGGLDERVRRWAVLGAAGAAFGLAGLVMLLPGDAYYYVPKASGLDDRLSVVAALGEVVVFVAAASLIAFGVSALLRRPKLATPLMLIALALTGANWLDREWSRQEQWTKAWQSADQVQHRVRRLLPARMTEPSSVVSFHHQNFLADGLPVFATSYDLDGALKLAYDNPRLHAHPWWWDLNCLKHELFAPSDEHHYRYGRLWFVDLRSKSRWRVRSQVQCQLLSARLSGWL